MTQPETSPLPTDAQALIAIGENEEGMHFQVRAVGKPLDTAMRSHYFAKWLSDNCSALMDMAMPQYAVEKELAETRARKAPKLIGTDGARLN